MLVQPPDRPRGQGQAGEASHLGHVIPAQGTQYDPHAARRVQDQPVPPVGRGARTASHQQQHALLADTPDDGQQRLAGLTIRPVQVLYHHRHRTPAARLGQQRNKVQPSGLRACPSFDAELLQHGERLIGRRLVGRSPQHHKGSRKLSHHMVDQRCLTRTRIPLNPRHPARPTRHCIDTGPDRGQLATPADEPVAASRQVPAAHSPNLPLNKPPGLSRVRRYEPSEVPPTEGVITDAPRARAGSVPYRYPARFLADVRGELAGSAPVIDT